MPRGVRGIRRNAATYGRLPDDQVGFLQLSKYTVSVFQNDLIPSEEIDSEMPEPLDVIRVAFRFPGRRAATTLNLTALTGEELTALRTIIDHAFALAEPIVDELDQRAQEAHDNGDDSYSRLYRSLPALIIRERVVRAHDQSVPDRPDGVDGLDPDAPNLDSEHTEPVEDLGEAVHHGEPDELVGQDDPAED